MKNSLPTFKIEKTLWQKDYCVIGVDEVGRGALAGPLYVGAVCFEKITFASFSLKERLQNYIENLGINDSKKLTVNQRRHLAKIIKEHALAYSTSMVNSKVINQIGIVKSTQRAIRRTVYLLIKKINGTSLQRPSQRYTKKYYLLADAYYVKYIKGIPLNKQKAIVHGDEKSISIAAASIIAKVERDHNMIKLHHKYPIYFWKNNKGYGTKKHIEAIKKFGKSKLHRDLFLRKIL